MPICPNCSHDNINEASFCAKCGAPMQVSEGFQPGDHLAGGRYRVESVLGEGGMGTVYKVLDTSLDRLGALKLLNPELTAHPTARRRMMQEAKVLARVEHPHVIRVRNVFTEGELLAMELEFMEGGDLTGAIPPGGMSESRTVSIMAQVLEGLHALHEAGLVHRDIKPDNVLLSRDGTPKLTDLGVARDSSAREKTKHGAVLGTPEYMAPEQIQGQAVDARADIYAAGVMMYRMLTGELPFQANTEFEWQAAHVQQAPNLEVLRGRFSESAVHTIERALEKSPAARWSSAPQMAAALRAPPASTPKSESYVAPSPQPLQPAEEKASGKGSVVLGIAGLIVAVGVGAAVFSGQESAKEESNAPATTSQPRATAESNTQPSSNPAKPTAAEPVAADKGAPAPEQAAPTKGEPVDRGPVANDIPKPTLN